MDITATICTSSYDRLLLCGNVNCPGSNGSCVDDGQASLVSSPTRGDNILDILATDTIGLLSDVHIDDAGCISDHRLVLASLSVGRLTDRVIEHTCRNIRRIVPSSFESSLRQSSLFTVLATTTHTFTNQLVDVVTSEMDKVEPLKCSSRRASKSITRWLSTDAVQAKRERRRLEKRWLSFSCERDRVAYRLACHKATKVINESRRAHFNQRLSDCTDSGQ